ncbi:MAG: RNA methyltransferase [Bacteroidetes bacterium]|nr:RNA methyltransferase [Bacteroidota bacterium]
MRKLRVDELGRKTVAEVKGANKIPVIVVLENIRSAYNVGSVFRTADAFLLEGVFLVGYTVFPPHKEIRKTALGAEESVSWKHFKTMAEAIELIRQLGYTLVAAEQTDRSVALHQWVEPVGPGLALIMGNEVTGVEQGTLEACEHILEIPQLGMKHSLNIATAAGVVLWELVRKKIINKA